jgi:iron complex transport system ATP-binding protein
MLAVEKLHVRLGGAAVLRGISAAFAPGRITAILGPNGAGKSTLLACLAGLRAADAGTVLLDGTALAAMPPLLRARRIGLLPQTAQVHWNIDVATLVGLGRFAHRAGWRPTAADHAAVARAMAQTDVAALAGRSVHTLSGGERGRALLARVLAGEPEWLLADEPLAGLDPAHQIDCLDALRGVAARGAGVVVVLHDLNHAARVADAVLILRAGDVLAAGAPAAVLRCETLAAAFDITADVDIAGSGRPRISITGRSPPACPPA